MEREILITLDGSSTIAIPQLNITYHSKFGAIQESRHVYVKAGLEYTHRREAFTGSSIHILEMGFGTGLNALLTIEYALQNQQKIYYHTVELNPLTEEESSLLNYTGLLANTPLQQVFEKMHSSGWNWDILIHPLFVLHKTNQSFIETAIPNNRYHLIYYDAFAPQVQPELWTASVFQKLYYSLKDDGILVTYCSKGDVHRAMQKVGFVVEKLQGPPGKREIIRAKK